MPPHIEFTILGPLDARLVDESGNSRPLALGPFKQRVLLAALLCRPNTFVPVDRLIETLWEDPPRTAHKNVQVYVSHLRQVLAADGNEERILHRARAYSVRVQPAELDAASFEDLVLDGRRARREGRTADAAAILRTALARWHGDALADLVAAPALRAEAAMLADRRLAAYEDWLEAELTLGRHLDVLDDIESLVRRHPLRERLRSQQLVALYRAGRQSEGLAEYDNLRRQLAAELGLEPSPALQRLYQAILSGNRSLERPATPGVVQNAVVQSAVVQEAVVEGAVVRRAAVLLAAPEAARPAMVAHSAGLPRDLPDFVGHGAALDELALLLTGDAEHRPNGTGPDGRVVIMSGAPGVGKTAAAVRLAHRLRRDFPDGQLLVPLRDADGTPLAPRAVLGAVLDQFGVEPAEQPDGESRRLGLFQGMLASRRVLLVYDDAAGEAQVRRLLPSTGPTSVLITSRRYLGGLATAHHRQLDPLPTGPALALLAAAAEGRTDLDRTDAGRAAAARIAYCCAGLPLALRIAGIRLGALRHLRPQRFADRLERAPLAELTVGDLSLRAALDRFWQELEPAERAAFRMLGRLPCGEFGPAEYAGVDGSDTAAAERVLEQLAQVHAVQPVPAETDEPRFRVIEPIRRFAAEFYADPSSSAERSAPGVGGA